MKRYKLLLFIIFTSILSYSQVGINTSDPDASSVLDIQYGTIPRGMLTPRMTSAQRTGIATPANGLLLYDTDLRTFIYNSGTSSAPIWTPINTGATGRTNFKLIKSTDNLATVLAPELAAGGNNKYKLDTNTLYEINGTVTLDKPIDLNNAYLQGLDSGEDVLVSSGNIFDGATGGTVKGLTIRSTAGKVFNISAANTENMIFRDCIVANSASVGSINGLGLVFLSVVQFSGNTTGITYSNINTLLLSNLGWFGNNTGKFETLTGTFGLVEKQGGFSAVNGSAVGFDVSTAGLSVTTGILQSVGFTGTLSGTGTYVKGYTTGTYAGYNFTNNWNVNCSGIPVENDATAVGDVNLDSPYGTGVTTVLTTGTAVKISGATVSNNFFRASNDSVDNRLKYLGNKKRFFTVNAVASFRGTANSNTIYVFYIALNGTPVQRSKTYIITNNNIDVVAVPVQAILELSPNDYVEVYVQRYSGFSDILTVSLSLFMR